VLTKESIKAVLSGSSIHLIALLGGLLELKRKLNEVRKIKLCVKLCVKSCVKCAKCAIGAIDKQPALSTLLTTNLITNRDNKFLMMYLHSI